jgi:uroporphyrinogen-III decarboxylase
MTPKQRMLTAMSGRKPDVIPVAPYIWGTEYVWKLLDKPAWQVELGALSAFAIMEVVQSRHNWDWILPVTGGRGFLDGKEVEERGGDTLLHDHVSGRRWQFLGRSHSLVEVDEQGRKKEHNTGIGSSGEAPILTKAEADSWLRKHGYASDTAAEEQNGGSVPIDPFVERYGAEHLVVQLIGGGFHKLAYEIGLENALIMLMDAPQITAYILTAIATLSYAACRRLKAAGLECAFVVDSWASADIMSPKAYADCVAPAHRTYAEAAHAAGLKAILWNSGNILPLMRTIQRLGYDAFSFEERIKGLELDVGEVRRMVGPAYCLFGNFDAYLLLAGDKARIEAEVRRQIESAGRDGAFIMGTGSPICDATDPDIIDFWTDCVRAYRA